MAAVFYELPNSAVIQQMPKNCAATNNIPTADYSVKVNSEQYGAAVVVRRPDVRPKPSAVGRGNGVAPWPLQLAS